MIHINGLLQYYPEYLRKDEYKMSVLKEYLQYKALNIIYNSIWGTNLILIGGTCLRILYDFRRFSDDLDFDFHGVHNNSEHEKMCEYICKELNKEDINAEPDRGKKIKPAADTMICYINFPGILFKQGIDPNPKKKLYIKIDAQYQNTREYKYEPIAKLINRFEVVRMIKTAPLNVLYSMKLCAVLSRARGRDFYDVMELINMVTPDREFLLNRLTNKEKPIKLFSSERLKKLLMNNLHNTDWNEKVSEVSRYLHNHNEIEKVKYFKIFIEQTAASKLFPIGL